MFETDLEQNSVHDRGCQPRSAMALISADATGYTSVMETDISLPNGTPIIHNGATTVAQRIVVELQ